MKIADNSFYVGVSSTGETKLGNTAEALATYIVSAGRYEDLMILDQDRKEILNTFGVLIDKCVDYEFLLELRKTLIPKQKAVASGRRPQNNPYIG